METLNWKVSCEMLEELAFYTKVLTLFENTESLTKEEIEKRVSFYLKKNQIILIYMADPSTNKSTNNQI